MLNEISNEAVSEDAGVVILELIHSEMREFQKQVREGTR